MLDTISRARKALLLFGLPIPRVLLHRIFEALLGNLDASLNFVMCLARARSSYALHLTRTAYQALGSRPLRCLSMSAASILIRVLVVGAEALANGKAGNGKAPLRKPGHAVDTSLLRVGWATSRDSGHSEPLVAAQAVKIARSRSADVDVRHLHWIDAGRLVGDNLVVRHGGVVSDATPLVTGLGH